jgi:hypothetical protein
VAVKKINGFRAPYRSQTFQEIVDAQTQRNGVVQMAGAVTQTGLTITVPAFTFVQQGLLVTKDAPTTLSAPTMDAPFYLVVSSPNSLAVDNLIFTFAKSPADITSNEAIVAAWDGGEWRMLPFLSVGGVLDDINQANIDFDRVGPFSGLNTVVSGSYYKTVGGTIVDKRGLRQAVEASALFPIVVTDPDWSRVDRIVYRRPEDSEDRIGVRKFLVGGTFSSAPATANNTQNFGTAEVRLQTKVLIGSDNAAHFFVACGYGGSYVVEYKKLAADRTTVLIAPTTIAMGLNSPAFDVVLDKANHAYLVCVAGSDVKWRKFDLSGSSVTMLTPAITIDAQTGRSLNPRVAIDPQNTKTYVTYQSLVTPSQDQVFMVTVDTGGTIVTPSKNLLNDAYNSVNPSIFVTDDFLVYVAWESLTETRVKYRVFDDIGNATAPVAVVSSATQQIGAGTLIDGAKSPKIWVTDNKKVIVSFLQNKGGLVYGLTLWTEGSAFMQQLLMAGEDITNYDLYVDPIFNAYHLVVVRSTSLDFVRVDGQAVSFTLNFAANSAVSVSTARDNLGSMITSWSSPTSSGYTAYDSTESILYIGPETVTGSIANVTLATDQFMIASTILQAPRLGDQVVITGSSTGNNGTYPIVGVTLVTLNSSNDRYVVQVATPFAAPENPAPAVNGNFQSPNGNDTRFIKSTPETSAHAYTFDELTTDLLLARIVMPGSVVLNYPASGGSVGGGGGMEHLVPFGAQVAIDWSKTAPGALTVSGGLKVLDLLNNFTYSLADGTYSMLENQAIYVVLDGSNFSPTPLVTNVSTLPYAQPIQVLGVIKGGEFNPHLLGQGGLGQLDSGEGVVFGEDLAHAIRTRLGILSETSYETYTSLIGIAPADSYPTAISQTNLMAGQNKHIRFVRAQMSWQKPNPNELVFVTAGYVQIPGVAESRNQVAPQTVLLGNDGDVAFVLINRTPGVVTTLTVYVSPVAGLPDYRDTLILARRVGGGLLIESTGQLVSPGSYCSANQDLASARYLSEGANLVFSSSAVIGFEGPSGANSLSWDQDLSINIPGRAAPYVVSAGTHELQPGECLYVEIPDDAPLGPLTPVVSAFTAVPLAPGAAGYSPRIKILWVREGAIVQGLNTLPTVSSGETALIGQELPNGIRARLGLTAESDLGFAPYTSTAVVGTVDPYPAAISKLDARSAVHDAHLFSLQGQADSSTSGVAALFNAVAALLSAEPLEETFLVGVGGQSIFNSTLLVWNVDPTSFDILVFVDGVKRELDPTFTRGYRKNSTTQIELATPAPYRARVTIRKGPGLKAPGYFVATRTGLAGQTQSSVKPYAVGTDRLGTYRNGVYLMKTASLSQPIDRFLEQSGIAVELGVTATASEVFTFVHQVAAPSYKFATSGVTGTSISVPAYVQGTKQMRGYRNGLLMNTSGLGDTSLQMSEASTTSIGLVTGAILADYFIFEVVASPPVWRQDLTGLTGTNVTFSAPYTLGDTRLLLFKNGQLMLNTTTLGSSPERYQEATTTTVTLGAAAAPADVFTAIYQ